MLVDLTLPIEVKSAPLLASALAQACPQARPLARRRKTIAERLLDVLADLAQGQAKLVRHSETAWASVTFAGTRHRVELEFAGESAVQAGECFIAFLPEHEFNLPGQLVADAAVVEVDHRLEPPLMCITCELLLLEEG